MLAGSTELNLPAAAAYALDHLLLESLHGVRIVQRVGRLEIGPERRAGCRAAFGRRPASSDDASGRSLGGAPHQPRSAGRAATGARRSTQVWEPSAV